MLRLGGLEYGTGAASSMESARAPTGSAWGAACPVLDDARKLWFECECNDAADDVADTFPVRLKERAADAGRHHVPPRAHVSEDRAHLVDTDAQALPPRVSLLVFLAPHLHRLEEREINKLDAAFLELGDLCIRPRVNDDVGEHVMCLQIIKGYDRAPGSA